MNVGACIDVAEATKHCRVFLNQVTASQTWWERLIGRTPTTTWELLMFSKQTWQDLPVVTPQKTPPPGLTPIDRMKWRQRHGRSFICYGAQLIIDGQCQP